MPVIKINKEVLKTIPWGLVAIFLCFSAAIILSGTFFYKSQRSRLFRQEQNDLTAIASLKVNQIEQWYNERLGDAAVIRDNEPLISRIKDYFRDKNQLELKSELTNWMESLNKEYDYRSILITDSTLKVRLSVSYSDTTAGDAITKELKSVLRNRTIFITDLHRANCINYVHIDILIPLIDRKSSEQNIFGVVILRIDPEVKLFPLIQSWPTPSKSSETLLLRKEGDSVLYLNELRHQKNTALKLKLSMTDTSLLASKAVMGMKGVFEGIDYRNIPVMGYLTGIGDSKWFMVAKVDKEEIQGPVRRYFIISVIIVLLLILINGSVLGFWIWNQQVRSYRSQLLNERSIKESEEALRENEKKLREAQEMAHLGFWKWDIKSGDVEWSEEVYKIFHLNPEEFTPQIDSILALSPWEEDHKRNTELINRAIATHEPGDYEQKFLRPDNSIAYYYSTFEGKYDHEGNLITIVGTVLDITELKKSEQILKESEDKFRYFFDHSVTGKSITFLTGDIHVNKSFCNMLGYKQKELDKSKWQEISHPDDLELIRNQQNSLISGEKDSTRFVQRYIHKKGSVVWADVGTSLRRDENGKPIYFMTSTNDITQRIQAEEEIHKLNEELEQRVAQRTEQVVAANRELEAFSYSVSHDLRAPLRSVHGYSKILLEEYEDKLDDEGKRLCGIISSSATQMGSLIDDLLSFSRIGRSSLNPLLLDMKSMVLSVFADICSNEEKSGITLKVGKLHKAYGDASLIRLVWINLISNAIKYSSKENSPEISISSSLKDHSISYSVMDNGVGFDMQYKHKLFGVFQRLHSGSEFEGNGVGLAIVQRIVLKHGGKVKAEGEAGKGATFCFSLPAGGNGQQASGDRKNKNQTPDAGLPMPDASQ